ncbi:uncharacterized protein N7503_003445 [Penicillium pulvis]|uniref:uncharacterized protein n=1 Tax=Penicillium pulvis TaxID=1562058 RepID=UPI0025493E84|nr:uncharacterized protein N7503_003445 [Penicillium pulvis]KAJ5805843.1 hypothetical protein N7503_003445 [Penicillium pulvis]
MAPPKLLAPTPGRPHKTKDHIITASTKATTACSSCQKRKIRCIGGIPCLPCQNAKIDCVSNLENDGRRKITLKRKIEALEQDRNLLMQLMDTIREDNKEKCPSVLDLIRSNAPLEEIKLYFAESLDQSNDGNTPPKRQESVGSSASTPRNVMDVKRICDTPIYPVPAQPWTSVSNDDALVSHLISLHFTWNGITSNWIDRDLFLRDMRSGNLDANFCSPLLVNSILAMACSCINWWNVIS